MNIRKSKKNQNKKMNRERKIINRVSKIMIEYEAPEISLAMDRAITKLAKLAGLKFSGSEYDFRTGIRNIKFK